MIFSSLNYLIILIFAMQGALMSQTLNARVSLRADRLQPEDEDIIREIPRNLEEYINNYRWGNEEKELTIRCDFNFIIDDVQDRSGQKVFNGQLIVSSQSGENFRDNSISFPYQRGQLMEHIRGAFDPLLGMVDYYVYMIIGGEMDTYLLRGGTQYYERARNLVSEGQVSGFSRGWSGRQETLETIRNSDHESLRDAKFYYYEGLFYIEQRRDSQRAPLYSRKVVELLDNVYKRRPNSTALKRFLDAHYSEFCKLFSYDSDRSNINAMMRIDNRHRESYAECSTGGSGGIAQ